MPQAESFGIPELLGIPRKFSRNLRPVSAYKPDIKAVATNIVALDGTGDYDDIQAAINDLPSGGGVVYIKEGTYTIASTLAIVIDNVALVGSGKSTKIQTSGNFQALVVVSHSGIHIEKIYFYGSGTGNLNYGISFSGVTNSTITSCWIENFGFDGILAINNSTGVTITSSHISSNFYSGIFFQGHTSGLIIANCVIQDNVQHGIRADLGNGSVISSNLITGNDTNNTGSYNGIYMNNSDDNIIIGNHCDDNDKYEIFLSNSDNNIVTGNFCKGTNHLDTIVDTGGSNNQIGHNITM